MFLDNVGVLGEGQASEIPHHENKSPHKSPQRPERPGSAMRNPASARPRTGRLKTARPPSARRPAPRLKEKGEVQAAAEEQFIQTRYIIYDKKYFWKYVINLQFFLSFLKIVLIGHI